MKFTMFMLRKRKLDTNLHPKQILIIVNLYIMYLKIVIQWACTKIKQVCKSVFYIIRKEISIHRSRKALFCFTP